MLESSSQDRRINLGHAEDFDLGAVRIRPALLEICGPDGTQVVERRVMQVLVALHRADGAAVSRDELIETCWAGLAVSDDAVTQCLSKLRRALAGVPDVAVASIPRIGYRLVVVAPADKKTGSRSQRPIRGWANRSAAVLAVIASALALGFDSRSGAIANGHPEASAPSTRVGPQEREADRLHRAAVRIFRERTRPGYFESERLLRRAVAIDPRHAASWARLAMAVYAPYWWSEKEDPEARARLRSEAIGYARRALSIDPNLAEGHQAMGFILRHDGGLQWYERAVALDPDNPEIRNNLAGALENELELRRASAELLRAMQLEPTSQQTVFEASSMLDRLGHRAEADALISNFEQLTHRAGDARRFRFELEFERGRLAEAAAIAATSLDIGDEDRWWRYWRMFDIATALGDDDLRERILRVQPRLAAIDYSNTGHAVQLALTRPNDWWSSPVVGGLARQLIMSGHENLLTSLYDDRYRNVSDLWKEHGDWADCLAPSLIVAMRHSGRTDESVDLRNHFAADIAKLTSEGDVSISLLVWRAELGALDGNASLAARWLDTAIDAGWKGQAAYCVGFEPDRDPVFSLVRKDPPMQRSMAHLRAAKTAEAQRLKKLNLPARLLDQSAKSSSA